MRNEKARPRRATQQALEKSETLFRRVVESAPNAFIMVDQAGRIEMVNVQTERLFGYRREELLGQTMEPLVPRRLRGHYARVRRRIFAADGMRRIGADVELFALKKDGCEFPVEIGLSTIETEDGNRMIFAIVDLTERKAAQLAYQRTETLLAQIVASSNDAIISQDLDGIVTSWNLAAERIFGYGVDEIVGQPLMLLAVPGREDDVELVLERVRAGAEVPPFETQRSHKNGTIIDVSVSASPIRDPNGVVLGAAKVSQDITKRKSAERRVAKLNQMYTMLSRTNIAIIHMTDRSKLLDDVCRIIVEQGRLAVACIAFVDHRTGLLTIESVAGPAASYAAEPSALKGDMTEAIASGMSVIHSDLTKDRRLVNRHGDYRRHNLNANTIFPINCGGKVFGALSLYSFEANYFEDPELVQLLSGMADDISFGLESLDREATRLATEEELRQAQKMEALGQLTGGLAHDFNNLLGVMLGYLEILRESVASDAGSQLLVDRVLRTVNRGAQSCRQLLAYARKQALAPKSTDLGPVLQNAMQLFSPILGAHIAVALDCASDLWPVEIDSPQLETSLLNLAVNARDAMQDGGSFSVVARNLVLEATAAGNSSELSPGHYVVISVSDTGEGMTADVVAKAFDPFFSTKGSRGTGLGLSMVYGFVKQSGGHTSIESRPGQGTTVKLHLPRAKSKKLPAENSVMGAEEATSAEMILVVEDNEELLGIAVHHLHSLGYRVLAAANSAHALAIVDACLRNGTTIDLLFTDVVMPNGMDGPGLAEEVQKLIPGLPVLFTSGFIAASEATILGDLLNKPYDRGELGRRIRAAIDRAARTAFTPPLDTPR